MQTRSIEDNSSKRFLRGTLSLVALSGVVLALWPVGQTVWARWHQAQLERAWQKAAAQPVSLTSSTRKSNIHTKSASTKKTQIADWPPTRIIIPEINLDAVVVQGEDEDSLRDGPGHDPFSALPGQTGNCVIAGHRNIYGSYFYRVDELLPGMKITLRTPHQSFRYQVVQSYQAADTQAASVKAVAADAPPMLTLYTCTLPRSTNRLIISAQLLPADAP